LLAELNRCETSVWQALLSGDARVDAQALDPSFLGVYADGFADKAAHVGQLKDGPTVSSFTLSQMRAMPLGQGFALLSYHAEFTRPKGPRTEAMYVSSIWRKDADGWRNVFSQDTKAEQ